MVAWQRADPGNSGYRTRNAIRIYIRSTRRHIGGKGCMANKGQGREGKQKRFHPNLHLPTEMMAIARRAIILRATECRGIAIARGCLGYWAGLRPDAVSSPPTKPAGRVR